MMIKQDFLPGFRIIKTTIAVVICLVSLNLINYHKPVYAAVACVLMMKNTPSESFNSGVQRTVGTILGGLISILLLQSMHSLSISIDSIWAAFIIALGVFIALILSKGFHQDSYVGSMAAIVIIITMMGYGDIQDDTLTYVIVRVLETIYGIIIAFLVNRYVNEKRQA